MIAKIREVAGEYFLGDMIGETGSSFACKFPGYFNRKEGTGADPTVIKTDYADMKAAHEEAEHSWRIAENVWQKRSWTDIANFGENDMSSSPAYGMFDIVPIEASVEKLSEYDYLVFLGWNSMTDENLDKLTEYVNCGGNLLMSAAHLNKSTVRGGDFVMPSEERLKKLFGARFTGETVRTNDGVKFKFDSIKEGRLYPGSYTLLCDPIYSAGYVEYAKFELCGGNDVAIVTGSFISDPSDVPAVIENKVGSGTATLVTSINYPGNPSLYPLYNAVVREMITESSRNCDIKVIGSDRLRWSVYEGDKIYLLNTDYDMPITVKVIKGEKAQTVTLNSLELRAIEL